MSLLTELKRRNVFRVGIFYAVLSWLILQVADVIFGVTQLPEWSLTLVAIILGLGFFPALIFAWVFELTPEGIKLEKDVDRSTSVTPQTARKLDIAVIVLLVVAIVLFVGDRFVGDRTGETPSAGFEGDRATSWSVPGRSTAGAEQAENNSVAVLPFTNMSADADNEYFADGISEEILNLLADVRDLSVASRTSAFGFKGKDTPIPEIASALNVRYVLEGSVRKAGEQVRVTAQLIDARTDRHLWSETFDRTLEDIFAIQDEIAGAIGDALKIELLGDEGAKVETQKIDPKVYALFLEARHSLRQRTSESLRRGNEMLIQVVEAEPQFARAHVVLGEAYLLNRGENSLVPRSVAVSQARIHAEIARSLNPRLSGIDLIMGSLAHDFDRDQPAALAHYSRAIELEPTEPRPYHWRGMLYCAAGYSASGLSDLKNARRLDPENPNVYFASADCMSVAGDLEGAYSLVHQGLGLGNPGGLRLVARIELLRGDIEGAIEAIRQFLDSGDYDDGDQWAALLTALETGSDYVPLESASEDQSIQVLAAAGNSDLMLDALLERDYIPNQLSSVWASNFTDLRERPRFIDAMNRFGFVDLWREKGPPADCRVEGDSFTCGHGSEP